MNNITVIGVDGASKNLEYTNGDSLMEVLRDAGYEEIAAMCGGCCSCATCHVHISDQAKFSLVPVEEDEEMLLEMADEYEPSTSRLSCQISLEDQQAGLTIKIVQPE
jgi:2Fe-2S ferredoxin